MTLSGFQVLAKLPSRSLAITYWDLSEPSTVKPDMMTRKELQYEPGTHPCGAYPKPYLQFRAAARYPQVWIGLHSLMAFSTYVTEEPVSAGDFFTWPPSTWEQNGNA